MIIIAHRGLMNGPDRNLENTPDQVQHALNMGFDVEIDVWYHQRKFYLGHDDPTHQVHLEFLRDPKLWIHAKNLETLYTLTTLFFDFQPNFFFHDNDAYTLTSHGYIWTYPGNQLSPMSVFVMPETLGNLSEMFAQWQIKEKPCYAVCTDYAILVDKLLNT